MCCFHLWVLFYLAGDKCRISFRVYNSSKQCDVIIVDSSASTKISQIFTTTKRYNRLYMVLRFIANIK